MLNNMARQVSLHHHARGHIGIPQTGHFAPLKIPHTGLHGHIAPSARNAAQQLPCEEQALPEPGYSDADLTAGSELLSQQSCHQSADPIPARQTAL